MKDTVCGSDYLTGPVDLLSAPSPAVSPQQKQSKTPLEAWSTHQRSDRATPSVRAPRPLQRTTADSKTQATANAVGAAVIQVDLAKMAAYPVYEQTLI